MQNDQPWKLTKHLKFRIHLNTYPEEANKLIAIIGRKLVVLDHVPLSILYLTNIIASTICSDILYECIHDQVTNSCRKNRKNDTQWLEVCRKWTMIQRLEGHWWNMRKPNAQTACCKNKICHETLGVNYQPQATSWIWKYMIIKSASQQTFSGIQRRMTKLLCDLKLWLWAEIIKICYRCPLNSKSKQN